MDENMEGRAGSALRLWAVHGPALGLPTGPRAAAAIGLVWTVPTGALPQGFAPHLTVPSEIAAERGGDAPGAHLPTKTDN